jgi:hypothetical protein
VLLVHAGNRIDLANRPIARFTPTQVPKVRATVGRVLDALRPFAVVSAAAAGADLIVLQEVIERGIGAHVVLPIPVRDFVKQSVMDAGPEWVRSFEAVLDHVANDTRCSLVQGDESPDDDWFLAGHDQLLDRAMDVADGDIVVALTVRPPEGENPPSATDDFAMRAERIGLLVLCIDPRPDSAPTVIVI